MRAAVIIVGLGLALAGCSDEEPDLGTQRSALAHPGPWQLPADVEAAGRLQTVVVTEAGPWRGEAGCSGTFTQGAQRLRDWIRQHWPQVTSIGGYNCRPINGNEAQMSLHATGRALDLHIPLAGGEADNDLGDPLANWLVVHAEEVGIQRIIWDRWTWSPSREPRSRAYNGAHPHHDHLHIELSVEAAAMGTAFFRAGLPPPDQPACGDPLPAGGGTVDNDDPCFNAYGPAQYWRSVGGAGVGGDLLWTNAYRSASPSNWARWRFELAAAGAYDVEAHVVAAYAVHDAVRYEVRHGARDSVVVVDPSGRDGWIRLGRFEFAARAPQWVSVFDNYDADPGDEQRIAVDAIRLRPPATEPEPDPEPDPEPEPEPDPEPEPEPDPEPEPEPDRDAGADPRDLGAAPAYDAGRDEDAGGSPFTPFDPSSPEQPTRGRDAAVAAAPDGASFSGGCAQAPAPPWFIPLPLLALLRRRRRTAPHPPRSPHVRSAG